jgi:hypothetical protein
MSKYKINSTKIYNKEKRTQNANYAKHKFFNKMKFGQIILYSMVKLFIKTVKGKDAIFVKFNLKGDIIKINLILIFLVAVLFIKIASKRVY